MWPTGESGTRIGFESPINWRKYRHNFDSGVVTLISDALTGRFDALPMMFYTIERDTTLSESGISSQRLYDLLSLHAYTPEPGYVVTLVKFNRE